MNKINPEKLRRARWVWDKIRKRRRKVVLLRDNYTCQNCGFTPKDVNVSYVKVCFGKLLFAPQLEVDHRRPLAYGGSNKLRNLQTLCNICNCCKGISVDDKWKQSKRMLRHYGSVSKMTWQGINNETTITNN